MLRGAKSGEVGAPAAHHGPSPSEASRVRGGPISHGEPHGTSTGGVGHLFLCFALLCQRIGDLSVVSFS